MVNLCLIYKISLCRVRANKIRKKKHIILEIKYIKNISVLKILLKSILKATYRMFSI